jgi:hypothetical protein
MISTKGDTEGAGFADNAVTGSRGGSGKLSIDFSFPFRLDRVGSAGCNGRTGDADAIVKIEP